MVLLVLWYYFIHDGRAANVVLDGRAVNVVLVLLVYLSTTSYKQDGVQVVLVRQRTIVVVLLH